MAVARSQGVIALSRAVYSEIAEVLARPKFVRVLTDDRCNEILALLSAAAIWVEPSETVQDCRDSKDNRYLELALAAGATAIVSGDDDLLVLSPWRGVLVTRPSEFVQMLKYKTAEWQSAPPSQSDPR